MNILTYTQRNLSAKFFAAITIVSMILSAFPVAFFVADAATIDFTVYAVPDPVGTDGDGEYVTISFIDTVDFAGWKLVDNNGDETDLTSLGIVSGPDDLQICSNMVFSTNGGVNCDLTFGTNFNLVNTAGQVQLVSPDPSVVVDLTWASVTVGQTVSDSGQYIEPSVACTPQHDAAGVTNIQNTSTGDYFDSIEDALADCDTSDGDIVELLGDITTTKQQRIARPIILDGNGYTIDAAFAKNGNDNNSAINVFGTSDVTVMDIVLDGTSGTELHGLNVYRSDDVVVSNLEAKNFRTGLLVNGSVVAASDITTSGNTWHAINVDKGSDDYPATLIISNTSSHAENSATPPSGHIPGVNKPHIYVDNANGFNTVIDDDSQYDIHEFFIPTVPAVQTQQFAVAIQVPGIKPQVYTLKSVTPEPVANIHTSKIVCTDEADLPNWVSAPSTITETTATDWLAEHKDSSCSLVRGWEFEWAPKGTSDPGDTLVGTAGPDWTTFTGSTQVPESAFDGGSFWVREVLQADYIPFTHESEGDKNTDDVTAEMYCHTDGLNYDNYDRIDDPEVGGDYYCVAWNVPVEKTSDVTICKYDQSEESLEGWQLALLGAEVDSLSVKPDGTTQSMLNVPAGFYVLKADGAYEYRGNTGLLADARFSERQAGDPDFGTYPYQPWREASAGTGGLAVQVNGDLGVSWGSTFSPSHVYYGALSQASLDDVDFYVYDNAYNDNVGEIDVTLYHGYTGITEEDGCVTFEDVPYGEYEVEELLQLDWTNLSGLGPVVVDEESEVFEVVNQDPNQEPVTCTLKLTSDDTNTVDEKGGAFAKVLSFIHNNWTTTLNDADWIWGDDGPVNPSQEETQTFSNKFGWSGATVVSATLSIAADNSFSATLDGDLAGEDLGEFNFGATKDYDVASLIDAGNNELSVVVKNMEPKNPNTATGKSNPAGLYYELTIVGEGEDCGVPYIPEPEEPEYGAYCGDGEINQDWEQCDGDDVEDGESCTDYCTFDNQCSVLQLVKVEVEETDSPSFDYNTIYLGSDSNPIPNGTWFNFDELGDTSAHTVADAVEGLGVSRDPGTGQLRIGADGANKKGFDKVVGTVQMLGLEIDSIKRGIPFVPRYKLEEEPPARHTDYADKISDTEALFDWQVYGASDGMTLQLETGEEYDCDECKATVEARIVVKDYGSVGAGDMSDEIILGDAGYSTVSFGEWFPISEATNPGDSAVMIQDPNTVTGFSTPADKPGLFVSRENGTVKVALYGKLENGGKDNNEWIDARIEVRDAGITNFQALTGPYKLENGYDSASADGTGVDFKMKVTTASDGFRFDIDEKSIAVCDEDTTDPDPETYRIDGYKYEVTDNGDVPKAGWNIYAENKDNATNKATVTDENGYYYFDVLEGNWEITEEVLTDWSQVEVIENGVTVDHEGDGVEYCLFDIPEDDSDYECDFYNEYIGDGNDGGGSDGDDDGGSGDTPDKKKSTQTSTRISRGAPGQVLGASTIGQCPFLLEYMQITAENNSQEVSKLQIFLNLFKDTFGGTENPVTGFFGPTTDSNVKAFQEYYRSEVLDPWYIRGIVPHTKATGYVYKTTLWKINSIVCPDYAVLPVFDGEDLNSNVDLD